MRAGAKAATEEWEEADQDKPEADGKDIRSTLADIRQHYTGCVIKLSEDVKQRTIPQNTHCTLYSAVHFLDSGFRVSLWIYGENQRPLER